MQHLFLAIFLQKKIIRKEEKIFKELYKGKSLSEDDYINILPDGISLENDFYGPVDQTFEFELNEKYIIDSEISIPIELALNSANFRVALEAYLAIDYGTDGVDFNGYSVSYGDDWYKDAESFAEDFNHVTIYDTNNSGTQLNITYSDIKTVFDDISNAFTFTDSTLTFSGDKQSDSISFSFDETVLPSGMTDMSFDFSPVGWAAFDEPVPVQLCKVLRGRASLGLCQPPRTLP